MAEDIKLEKTKTEEAKWYVVHTYSGYENKVRDNICKSVENRGWQHLIQRVEVPVEEVVEIDKNGKEKIVKQKTFPGYVVIKMVHNTDTWYVVRNTRGVTGFVGPGSEPVPLTEEEAIKIGVEGSREIKPPKLAELDIKPGDRVKFVMGDNEGFYGIVEEIDTGVRPITVKVSLDKYNNGNIKSVTVNYDQVALAD